MKVERPRANGELRGTTQLFVYGTLMRGRSLHKFLTRQARAEFMGTAKARGRLYRLHNRRYPGAILNGRGTSFVYGELYRVNEPEPTLRALDHLEGCDEGLFRRRLVDVWTNGSKTKAWAYVYARPLDRARPIPAGRFKVASSLS